MSKTIIFFVHGMGSYEDTWATGVKDQFKSLFAVYPGAASEVDGFQLDSIWYDDVFEKWRTQWKEDAAKAAKAATQLGLDSGMAEELLRLAGSTSGDQFLKTHVLDVVLYRFVKQIRTEVQDRVASQILSRLDAAQGQDLTRWAVVAHSLGTSVMHDSLQAMFTGTPARPALSWSYSPWYLFMVANVGRVLWPDGNFYRSEVRPHAADYKGMCYHYGNFRHALDPIPQVEPFHPPAPGWLPAGQKPDTLYTDVEIDASDVQELNVHSLSHYLSHPDVHIPILRTLCWQTVVTPAQQAKALKEWRSKRLQGQLLGDAKGRLEALQVQAGATLVHMLRRLFALRLMALADGINPLDGEH